MPQDSNGPAHYVIFHPESKRGLLEVTATALVGETVDHDWQGEIWVDKPPGNEDPFVLVEPWVYSYCHATQLKRRPRKAKPYVTHGSYLFFCNGQAANLGVLEVDTVFVVDQGVPWKAGNHGGLPDVFAHLHGDEDSRLWSAHLQYGGKGHHPGVFTYTAKLWTPDAQHYSFLPLTAAGQRPAFTMESLTPETAGAIRGRVRGKYPAPLSREQAMEVLSAIVSRTAIKAVRHIHDPSPYVTRTGAC